MTTTTPPLGTTPLWHPTLITMADVGRILRASRFWCLRLEQHPFYAVDLTEPWVTAYLAGEPMPGRSTAGQKWLATVAKWAADGRPVERVRVFEDDPTPYQRALFEYSAANVAAGERQRYLSRSKANANGLRANVTGDWWWVDDLVIVFHVGPDHSFLIELVDEPSVLEHVERTWALAQYLSEEWVSLPA